MAATAAIDGSTNVTVVTGAARTGLYAPDGSINVVQVDGNTLVGRYHPCGAYNVFRSTGSAVGHNHSSGAFIVSKNGAFVENTRKVTVVSGVLT
jgi:hypothetical protein